jgi:hypothetical protein
MWVVVSKNSLPYAPKAPDFNANADAIQIDGNIQHHQLGGPNVSPFGTSLYGQACQSQP